MDLRRASTRVPARDREKIMPRTEGSEIDRIQTYRPPCPCGSEQTELACIEPDDLPGSELRRFECRRCGSTQVLKVKLDS
jgi:hypothetical protein